MATRFYIFGVPPGLSSLDCEFLDGSMAPVTAWVTQAVTQAGVNPTLGTARYFADVDVPPGAVFIDWSLTGQAQSLGDPEQIAVEVAATLPAAPTLPTTALAPPSDLVAVNGEGVTLLMWGAVPGATGYNVYASTDGGPYVQVNTAGPANNPVYTVPVPLG